MLEQAALYAALYLPIKDLFSKVTDSLKIVTDTITKRKVANDNDANNIENRLSMIQLQQIQDDLLSIIRAQEMTIAPIIKHEAVKSRYRLSRMGTRGMFHAYKLKESHELTDNQEEPTHFACPVCFGERISILITTGVDGLVFCPRCKLRVDAKA